MGAKRYSGGGFSPQDYFVNYGRSPSIMNFDEDVLEEARGRECAYCGGEWVEGQKKCPNCGGVMAIEPAVQRTESEPDRDYVDGNALMLNMMDSHFKGLYQELHYCLREIHGLMDEARKADKKHLRNVSTGLTLAVVGGAGIFAGLQAHLWPVAIGATFVTALGAVIAGGDK